MKTVLILQKYSSEMELMLLIGGSSDLLRPLKWLFSRYHSFIIYQREQYTIRAQYALISMMMFYCVKQTRHVRSLYVYITLASLLWSAEWWCWHSVGLVLDGWLTRLLRVRPSCQLTLLILLPHHIHMSVQSSAVARVNRIVKYNNVTLNTRSFSIFAHKSAAVSVML